MISFDPSYTELHRQAEHRLKMEKQDAEYARSIANSHGFVSGTPATSSKPSAFNKMLGVRPQAFSSRDDQVMTSPAMPKPYGSHDSSRRRTLPWEMHTAKSNPDVKAERRRPSLAQSSNFDFNDTPGTPWNGPSTPLDSNSMSMPHVPGAYVEDPSTASDSDVEIIDSSAFRDNGRQKTKASKNANANGHQRSFYSLETRALGETALSRTNTSLQNSRDGSKHTLPGWPANSANEMRNTGRLGRSNNFIPSWAIKSANGMDNESRLGEQHSALPMWARGTTWNPSSQMSTAQQGPSMNSTSSGHSVYDNSDKSDTRGFSHPNSRMVLQGPSYPLPGSYGGSMHKTNLGYTVDNVPSYDMRTTSLQQNVTNNMSHFSDYAQDLNTFRPPTHLTTEMRDRMDHVMNDPRKTEKEIKDLLENIKADIEIPLEDREGTPEGLKYPLVS